MSQVFTIIDDEEISMFQSTEDLSSKTIITKIQPLDEGSQTITIEN